MHRMGVQRLEDLAAYQLAVEFKLLVYGLLEKRPAAQRDFKYCDQLRDATSGVEGNIAEGWRRYLAGDMAQFVRVALASLEEAKVRLGDGVHRRYFSEADIQEALAIGRRCGAATMGLLRSLLEIARRKKLASKRRPKRRKPPGP
jgi:four helix bundle protein